MARIEKEEIITSYKGNVLVRLLSYLKNYKKNVVIISMLCLGLTAIDLIRPMIISTGIDTYINGYQKIYVKVQEIRKEGSPCNVSGFPFGYRVHAPVLLHGNHADA